ncbi:MAG: right-handed parallel beta-helix repeat-containing protein [Phycisphaerales bacterium]|nr:right-handed parallel beta-helix repeat-containing protein [Phycisphaerales bacterium]
MRIATASAVVITILAGNSLAEEQRVNINSAGFDPDVIRAAPGDSVTWRWVQFGGGVSFSSGEPCTADGLFQFNLTGGPFGNPTGTWEVPIDFAYGEVPYFNNATCEDGGTALVLVVERHEVPGEFATIQAALDACVDYDIVSIAPGTYYETDLRPTTASNVQILGALDEDGLPAVFIGPEPGTVSAPSIMTIDGVEGLEIEGIHFTGARGTDGGALAVASSSVVVRDCRFTDNTASLGGCVSAFDSDLAIQDCHFEGNSADEAGCVHLDASEASLISCWLAGNDANAGGALSSLNSTLLVDDCWVRSNIASSSSGVFLLETSTTTIANSLFCANTPNEIVGDWVDEGVAFYDDCPVYDYTVHHVSGGNGQFTPRIVRVQPGDTITWFVDVTSGEPCTPDGLFEFTNISGPPFGNIAAWEVPLGVAYDDIPYFNPDGCKDGMTGIIRVANTLEVPGEYATIQGAIDAASPRDIISIAPGTYAESGLVVSTDDLLFQVAPDDQGDSSVVIGPEAGTTSSPSIVTIDGADGVEFIGIHFTGARAVSGGAIAINDGSAVITDCLFTDNESLVGGALSCISGAATITDCTFRENASELGGGAFFEDSTATFDDCEFELNAALSSGGKDQGLGGAIAANGGTLTISESILRDNQADSGGGLHLTGGMTSIGETRVCGNTPDQIVGTWTDVGGALVRDSCSIHYVPEDFPTIEDAFDIAEDGDTIYIAAGFYQVDTQYGLLLEEKSASLIGETNPDGSPAVEIDAAIGVYAGTTTPFVFENLNVRTLVFYDCTGVVTNCNIEFGYESQIGLFLSHFVGTIKDCRVANCNSNFLPGGVYITDQLDDAVIAGTDVDFIDVMVENNSGGCPVFGCSSKSGVRIENGVVDFVRCVVRNNYSTYAGVSFAGSVQLSLTDTTVCGNTTPGQINDGWVDNGGNIIADECPPDCPADINGDGIVDGADLSSLLGAWGESDGSADIDGSGLVDGADLAALLGDWGDC